MLSDSTLSCTRISIGQDQNNAIGLKVVSVICPVAHTGSKCVGDIGRYFNDRVPLCYKQAGKEHWQQQHKGAWLLIVSIVATCSVIPTCHQVVVYMARSWNLLFACSLFAWSLQTAIMWWEASPVTLMTSHFVTNFEHLVSLKCLPKNQKRSDASCKLPTWESNYMEQLICRFDITEIFFNCLRFCWYISWYIAQYWYLSISFS